MVKVEEHINKMKNIKIQADNSKGQQRLQLMKCYHKLSKQLAEYYINTDSNKEIKYIKYIKN